MTATWGIPERVRRMIFAGWVTETEATKATRDIRGLLVLSGNAGSGKTIAACEWLSKQTGAVAFLSAARLARIQRYDNETMDRLLSVGSLVIDDLGTEYMDEKGNFMSILDELVNDRYANGRPTIITTNLTVEEFRERYKVRIADRIRETGAFVGVAGDSRRAPVDEAALDLAVFDAEVVQKRKREADAQRVRDERDDFFRKRDEKQRREVAAGMPAEVIALADAKSVAFETSDQVIARENAARNRMAEQLAERARRSETAPGGTA